MFLPPIFLQNLYKETQRFYFDYNFRAMRRLNIGKKKGKNKGNGVGIGGGGSSS